MAFSTPASFENTGPKRRARARTRGGAPPGGEGVRGGGGPPRGRAARGEEGDREGGRLAAEPLGDLGTEAVAELDVEQRGREGAGVDAGGLGERAERRHREPALLEEADRGHADQGRVVDEEDRAL